MLQNIYDIKLYDENGELLLSKTFHNLAMSKRYAALNLKSLYLIYGGIFPWDMLKFTDGNGNWLPGMAKQKNTLEEIKEVNVGDGVLYVTRYIPNPEGGATNTEPVSINDKKYNFDPPVFVTDKSLFGTPFIGGLPLSWKIREDLRDISGDIPQTLNFNGKNTWGYHSLSDSLNDTYEEPDPTIVMAKTKDVPARIINGYIITDCGLTSDAGVVTHAKMNTSGEFIKRPPQKINSEINISYNIPPPISSGTGDSAPFYLNNFTPFIPQANALYGHRCREDSSQYLPQFYPEMVCVSSYPVKTMGSYCYPIPTSNYGVSINRLSSEKPKEMKLPSPNNPTEMVTIDQGWTELDYTKEDEGEWHGFPIFYYIGNIDSGENEIPKEIELPNEKDVPKVEFPEEYLDSSLSTKGKIAPTFIVQQWLVRTYYDEKKGRNLAIIHYYWDLDITYEYADGRIEKEYTTIYVDEKDKYTDGAKTEEYNNSGTKITTIYKKSSKGSTSTFYRTPVTHMLNGNKYYNWNCLKPLQLDAHSFGYQGPVRSIVFKNFSAKKYTKRDGDEDISVTLRIGTGDGVSTIFYQPFIGSEEWASGTVTSVYCDSASVREYDDYTPITIFKDNYSVYSKDLSTLYFTMIGGKVTYGSIFEAVDNNADGTMQYPAGIGYHKKTRTSHWNINPFNLKYSPVGEVLGFNQEAIVYEGDILSGQRLYYWFGQNGGIFNSFDIEILRCNNLDLNDIANEQESVILSTPSIITDNIYHDFSEGNGRFNYTVVRVVGNGAKSPRVVGSGISYQFFEPSALRFSIGVPITGRIIFDNPPAAGSPIYITANTSVPFFHEKTKIELKFLYKVGEKDWNGTLQGHKGQDVLISGEIKGGREFEEGGEF